MCSQPPCGTPCTWSRSCHRSARTSPSAPVVGGPPRSSREGRAGRQSPLGVIVMSRALTPTPTMVGWPSEEAEPTAAAAAVNRVAERSAAWYSRVSTLPAPGAAVGATARREPRRRLAGAASVVDAAGCAVVARRDGSGCPAPPSDGDCFWASRSGAEPSGCSDRVCSASDDAAPLPRPRPRWPAERPPRPFEPSPPRRPEPRPDPVRSCDASSPESSAEKAAESESRVSASCSARSSFCPWGSSMTSPWIVRLDPASPAACGRAWAGSPSS